MGNTEIMSLQELKHVSFCSKHRFVPPATKMSQYFVMRQIVWDESNARLLDAPYINEKQEQAYLQSVGRAHPEYQDEFLFKKLVIPDKQNYAADFLVTLDSNRPFESYE